MCHDGRLHTPNRESAAARIYVGESPQKLKFARALKLIILSDVAVSAVKQVTILKQLISEKRLA